MTKKKKKSAKSKKPIPLAPPPTIQSRKRARIITTLFHKHTRDRDLALQNNDVEAARESEEKIEAMGGRVEYQRASVCSTKHHSTSKWVLKVLGRMDWLNGIITTDTIVDECEKYHDKMLNSSSGEMESMHDNVKRRNVRLLEVGAINTDLLDAASRQKTIWKNKNKKRKRPPELSSEGFSFHEDSQSGCNSRDFKSKIEIEIEKEQVPFYRLDVRAIDIHSMHEKIEEIDFLKLSFRHKNPIYRYDAIVCSMVINCVTTPKDRGKMLSLLFHHLRPGGICFLTLPKLCLYQSKYINIGGFHEILTKCIGFQIQETKESPKVAFFALRRPCKVFEYQSNGKKQEDLQNKKSDDVIKNQENIHKWTELKTINRGKKYRNTFSVVLEEVTDFGTS